MIKDMRESAGVSKRSVQAGWDGVGWGGLGWGGVTCDNVEAVRGVQDLLQPDHVGVLCQHTHDSHLLHDALHNMPGPFPHLVLHSVGWHYTAHA